MSTPWIRAVRWAAPALIAALPLFLAPPTGETAPAGPRVEVRSLAAAGVAGRLVGLDATTLRLETAPGQAARALPLDRIVEVRFPAPAEPRGKEARMRAHLTGGDVLVGRLAGPGAEGIRLAVDGLGTLDLSFDVILTLEALQADAGPCHRPADGNPRAESGDIAYDLSEDEYRGTVLEATGRDLVMDSTRGRRRTVPWSQLSVLHLENDPLEPSAGLQTELELANGSRLALAGAPQLTETGMVVKSRSLPDASLAVPYVAARTLRWWGGRFVYATMLPFRNKRTPYYTDQEEVMPAALLERWFGLRVNRRASGCPLRLGGITYRHGFGVNSHSTIELPLGGAYRTFRAVFGIDDEVLQEARDGRYRGEVSARVLGDGKVLWEAKSVEGGQKPRRIGPIDVAGVQQLVLEVGFGRDEAMYTLDRADWVEPILERK